jgi:16S rRNA G966 N2-methylase RsmD
MNRLYFGDNLKWLSDRKEFPDASVDLVYLDPPFNSNADYNVLFREPAATATLSVSEVFTTSSFFILAVISQFGMTFTNRTIQNTSTNTIDIKMRTGEGGCQTT